MLMRFESADDGISTAVVLCLQSGILSQGTNPAAAWSVLAEEALQRCLDSTVGCGSCWVLCDYRWTRCEVPSRGGEEDSDILFRHSQW